MSCIYILCNILTVLLSTEDSITPLGRDGDSRRKLCALLLVRTIVNYIILCVLLAFGWVNKPLTNREEISHSYQYVVSLPSHLAQLILCKSLEASCILTVSTHKNWVVFHRGVVLLNLLSAPKQKNATRPRISYL